MEAERQCGTRVKVVGHDRGVGIRAFPISVTRDTSRRPFPPGDDPRRDSRTVNTLVRAVPQIETDIPGHLPDSATPETPTPRSCVREPGVSGHVGWVTPKPLGAEAEPLVTLTTVSVTTGSVPAWPLPRQRRPE